MIEFVQNKDMFTYDLDILVNTVNCVGIMGKGIALEFKHRFPEYYRIYKDAWCRYGHLKPGRCYPYLWGDPYIFSFTTKDHWRDPSKIEWIESGLKDMKTVLTHPDLTGASIGIPALGCNNGGLSWMDVKPLIVKELGDINNRVVVFEPLEGKYEQSIHEVQGAC